MTLSLFWSRYTLELQEQHTRDIDAFYSYLVAREKWNWFLAKIPESVQVKLLHGHNHGKGTWTCRKWLSSMEDWIKENKSAAVYAAVQERIRLMDEKPIKELEQMASYNISDEELSRLQAAGYFMGIRKDKL
jgi:hypothetical protein